MGISYIRPPTNPDGARMTYQERSAARRAADFERRQETGDPPARDPFYDRSYEERRGVRRAEQQGRREGEQRGAVEEAARKQAELDAIPEHERRPNNQWRDLIEARRPDAWRKDVARRIKVWERQAKLEDARIDAIMSARKRQHELESQPEYVKALAHWERAHVAAESEQEREEWARLKGVIEGGGAMSYWDQVAPIMQARLAETQERWDVQLEKQAAVVGQSKALAAAVEAVSDLQIVEQDTANASDA